MGISKKRAAIDLGTNSFRLLIAEVEDTTYTTLRKELITVRMGADLQEGTLSSESIERGLAAISRLEKCTSAFGTATNLEIVVCGTEVFRRAPNGPQFIAWAESILGTKIKILSTREEAMLSRHGALCRLDCHDNLLMTVDAGGGSTELSVGSGRHLSEQVPIGKTEDCRNSAAHPPQVFGPYISIPVGAVTLTTAHLGNDIRTAAKIAQLRAAAEQNICPALAAWRHTLEGHFPQPLPIQTIVASGGTATALACLDLGLTHYDESTIQGHILNRIAVDTILQRLTNLSPTEANKLPGLDNRRGEILIAGLIILETIVNFWGLNQLTVTDTGLLEGILLVNDY